VSHDAQGRRRGVHFEDRARGAKIGPPLRTGGGENVENVSNGFCGGGSLGRLACHQTAAVERTPKIAPKRRRFLPPIPTATETYVENVSRKMGFRLDAINPRLSHSGLYAGRTASLHTHKVSLCSWPVRSVRGILTLAAGERKGCHQPPLTDGNFPNDHLLNKCHVGIV
jgi:hypothetical protein